MVLTESPLTSTRSLSALRRESVSPERIRAAFLHYMQSEPGPLYRHDVEAALASKMTNNAFLNDIRPLLRPYVVYNAREAYGARRRHTDHAIAARDYRPENTAGDDHGLAGMTMDVVRWAARSE